MKSLLWRETQETDRWKKGAGTSEPMGGEPGRGTEDQTLDEQKQCVKLIETSTSTEVKG